MTGPSRLAELARNFRPDHRVRFNAEDFGFIVGFPSGDIVLTMFCNQRSSRFWWSA